MKYLVNSAQMKECDSWTIREMKVPSMVLMERAALAAAEEIKKEFPKADRILVLCGSGNNGGDGFAVARLFLLEGKLADVCFVGKEEAMTPETALQKTIFENYGGKICRNPNYAEYNLLVDALFGIGLSRPVTGELAGLLQELNESGLPVAAIDMPSGVSADTGQIMGTALQADLTVTFAFAKLGQILYPGTQYCGKLIVRDIGITAGGREEALGFVRRYEPEDLRRLPERQPRSNKGTYGKVLLIGGASGMAGAMVLAGEAAYRTGCGLVRIFAQEPARTVIQGALPEALFSGWEEERPLVKDLEYLRAAMETADVIGIGPGLGRSKRAEAFLQFVLERWTGPLTVDADALNLLARNPALLQGSKARIVITPHPGEMSRLTGKSVGDILEDIPGTAESYAKEKALVCVLKDARTAVAGEGKRYLNVSGNDGMATAGAGDVLTGVICGLLAQGMPEYEAACMGVYLHGLAGDAAAKRLGNRSLLAGDIIKGIAEVLNDSISFASL